MTRMPGTARYARALLIALGLSGLVCALRLTAAAAAFESGALGGLVLGMLLTAAAGCAVVAVAALVVSARFAEGGGAVRRGTVVVGWVIALGSLGAGLAHHFAWSTGIAPGVLLVALSSGESAKEWFARDARRPPSDQVRP
ncbi:hypothetical protein ACFWBB_13395 [Streptomyces sp. NPDC060000]|uniref:hypothetical protein n=1 Tax=Streptomyces sp. NPDC060000 TaxID=3347031 RepID=UPI0036BC77DC